MKKKRKINVLRLPLILFVALTALVGLPSVSHAQTGTSTLTNNSGGTLTAGAVVVVDSSGDKRFTTTTTADDTQIVGVVFRSVNNGSTGLVTVSGYVDEVLVNGAVAVGDYLGTHTSAGYAASNGASGTGSFAIALEANASGNGSIAAVLVQGLADFGTAASGSFTISDDIYGTFGNDTDFKLGYDETTDNRLEWLDTDNNLMLALTDAGTTGTVTLTNVTASTLLATDASKNIISNPGTISPTFVNTTLTGNLINQGDNVVIGASAPLLSTSTLELHDTAVNLRFYDTDATANQRLWYFQANTDGVFNLAVSEDDGTSPYGVPLSFTRSASTITDAAITATNIALTGAVTASGDMAVNGGDQTSTATSYNFLADGAQTAGINIGGGSTVTNAGSNTNGVTTYYGYNSYAGAAAYGITGVGNGSSTNDGITLVANGTAYTTSGAFVQDGGMLLNGPNLSGGMSIVNRNTVSPTRFYNRGSTAADLYLTLDDINSENTATWNARTVQRSATFTTTDTTPSIAGGNVFTCGVGTAAITDFDDAVDGQEITIVSVNTATTIADNAGVIEVAGGTSWAPDSANDIICFVSVGGVWLEKYRVNN